MCIDSPEDLAGMQACGRIVREALEAMRRFVRPGVTTAEINDHAAQVLQTHGARSAPMLVYRFPGETCISVNDEIVHGIPSDRVVLDGDLITIDVTAEKDGYFTDAAMTLPVGQSDPRHDELIGCARRAFDAAMGVARAGARISEIGRAVQAEIEASGFAVFRELCGHGIGRSIHEQPAVPNYYDAENLTELTDGLVIAVEPMASAGSCRVAKADDGWTIKTADGALSSHFEQTVMITSGEPIILTA